MRRLSLLLLAVVAIVLAAGCGGSSRDDFESSVIDTRNSVDGALTHITDNPSSKEELLSRMEQSAVAIDRAAERLDQEKAPDEFEAEQDQLVKAYRQLGVDIDAAAKSLREPEFENLVTGSQGLSFESWNQANRVLGKLRTQGIDVKPLGRH
jgi:ABC-type enterochelin transport system substrate-binding protein